MTDKERNRIVHLALDAGTMMLENGAETYRVEDTVIRFCKAFDIPGAESFAMPTGLFVSTVDKYGEPTTLIHRIKNRGTDMEKISRLNDLSRKIKNHGLTVDEVEAELKAIRSVNKYNESIVLLVSCFLAAIFALVFGGNFYDALAAFFVGGLVRFVCVALGKAEMNAFFINVVGGGLAALAALTFTKYGIGKNLDKIVIGSIMQLVPGLAITNAIRDTISGDLIAGISRAVESVLIAVAIAVGAGLMMKLWIFYGF